MALKYNIIEIFTSEEARYKGKPLHNAIVQYVSSLKLAARCMVAKGIEGCYENGEIATQNLLILSFNMPLKIEIILPTPELELVLPAIEDMVSEGIVVVEEMEIRCHKTKKRLIPRQIRVKDVMTPSPRSVLPSAAVSEVIRLLLSSDFNGVPVVDENNIPIGIITQGDLISRASMPIRLGLLKEYEHPDVDSLLKSLSHKVSREIMTHPPVTIDQDKQLSNAADLMLSKGLKRLPVTDAQGHLVGMLSRVDIFHTITHQSPDWKSLKQKYLSISNFKTVRDIMRSDTHRVLPDTPILDILNQIDINDIQRVAVVDAKGCFLGLISDKDLLGSFSTYKADLLHYLFHKLPITEKGRTYKGIIEHIRAKKASDVMKVNVITIRDDTSVDEAIRIMTEHEIKRLPVINAEGIFQGMISRDSLLRMEISNT